MKNAGAFRLFSLFNQSSKENDFEEAEWNQNTRLSFRILLVPLSAYQWNCAVQKTA
jgi:hypothetical protein